MNGYRFVATERLDIAYLEWNPQGSRTAILLHGWPDSPECWKGVALLLADAGFRVLTPALRGFAPTRFRDPVTPRSGQLSALGRDVLDFIEALELDRPTLIGHDWGARAAANACGLREGVASHLVMISVGYGTNDPSQPLPLVQARNYWYHWFMATPRGVQAVREAGEAFARMMWDRPAGTTLPISARRRGPSRATTGPTSCSTPTAIAGAPPRAIRPMRTTNDACTPRPSCRGRPWCCMPRLTATTIPTVPRAAKPFLLAAMKGKSLALPATRSATGCCRSHLAVLFVGTQQYASAPLRSSLLHR